MLEIICLCLFSILIIYFVVSGIVIYRYRKMRALNRFLLFKYSILSKKSFATDRALCLFNMQKLSISEVNDSFISLYKEITDIDSHLSNTEV